MKNKETMPFIEQLLNGENVEWKKLGEVAELKRGKVISKVFMEENKGIYPVYSSQTANNGEIGKIKTYDFNQEAITWTTDGANAGTVFYRKGKFSITNVCGLIKISYDNLLSYKFLYYWLSVTTKEYVNTGMGNPKLMSNQVKRILIPLPPLSVQHRIVEILDKFTALEAELEANLEAELDCRKRQYEYYRNQLLSFDILNRGGQKLNSVTILQRMLNGKTVEWKPLGEVCELQNGFAFKSSLFRETGLPIIRITNINGRNIDLQDVKYFYSDDYKLVNFLNYTIDKGDILIAMSGATTGKIGYYNIGTKAYLNQRVGKFIPDDKFLNNRFLYHFLLTKSEYLYNLAGGGAQPNLSSKFINKLPIPLPPLSVQREIVEILDKFDTLCNSISEGLPKEIELRRKQYEYYRNQLLTFAQ